MDPVAATSSTLGSVRQPPSIAPGRPRVKQVICALSPAIDPFTAAAGLVPKISTAPL